MPIRTWQGGAAALRRAAQRAFNVLMDCRHSRLPREARPRACRGPAVTGEYAGERAVGAHAPGSPRTQLPGPCLRSVPRLFREALDQGMEDGPHDHTCQNKAVGNDRAWRQMEVLAAEA